jgi:hypothetical protein
MTDPFFLENADRAGPARRRTPFVIAHEWAHLMSYAHDESEANFARVLTCRRGDGRAVASRLVLNYVSPSRALANEALDIGRESTTVCRPLSLFAHEQRRSGSQPAGLRQIFEGESCVTRHVELRRRAASSSSDGLVRRAPTQLASGACLRAGRGVAPGFGSFRKPGRIELVDFGRRERRVPAPGAEIVRLHVRIHAQEFDLAPLPPAALMASIRLPIRHFLTEAFEAIAAAKPSTDERACRHSGAFHIGLRSAKSSTAETHGATALNLSNERPAGLGPRRRPGVFDRRHARDQRLGKKVHTSVSSTRAVNL